MIQCDNVGGKQFETVRADVKVRGGKWYYEVKLLGHGKMHIGWCTDKCNVNCFLNELTRNRLLLILTLELDTILNLGRMMVIIKLLGTEAPQTKKDMENTGIMVM